MRWAEQNAIMVSKHRAILKILDRGYQIKHDLSQPEAGTHGPAEIDLEVHVYKGNLLVGRVSFGTFVAHLHMDTQTYVHEQHKRRGISTAMYVYAEIKMGLSIHQFTPEQTKDAKALWNQPNRPFGNELPAQEPD